MAEGSNRFQVPPYPGLPRRVPSSNRLSDLASAGGPGSLSAASLSGGAPPGGTSLAPLSRFRAGEHSLPLNPRPFPVQCTWVCQDLVLSGSAWGSSLSHARAQSPTLQAT